MSKLIHVLILLLVPFLLLSQMTSLQWLEDDFLIFAEDSMPVLAFEGGHYMDASHLPYYFYSEKLSAEEAENFEYTVSISNSSKSLINDVSKLNICHILGDFKVISSVTSSRKEYNLEVIIIPFKTEKDEVFRLESFQLNITPKPIIKLKSASSWFANRSVLSTGDWTKVAVSESGVYKLTYRQLSDMGLTPSEVSIFTSTPGKLSTTIQNYVDDLNEISIYDGGDYILFYAQGHNVWNYNSSSNSYVYTGHPYWNENYFYITSDVGDKKRISPSSEVRGTSTTTYTSFVDYDCIEPQEYSILHSGDDWFSQPILNGEEFNYTFIFDNIVKATSTMTMSIAAQSFEYSSLMKAYIDDNYKETISLDRASSESDQIKADSTIRTYSFVPKDESISATLLFECKENVANGFVDYVSLEVNRYLKFNDKQLIFRNKPTLDSIVTYQLSNVSLEALIWDISNVFDVKSIAATTNNGIKQFKTTGDQVKEFVAINPLASFSSPSIIGKVENQNIHGQSVPDMLILTTKDFVSIAEDLAIIHRKEGLDVFVTTQEMIFNEFSGGKADVTAIRWMMKMFYDRSMKFKYLLLLGDGDVNNRLYEEGSSLIMTYQSNESLNPSGSYVSDDYFGLLDDKEGDGTNIELFDKVDIGIGRIPISTVSEGNDVVNKIDYYLNNSKRSSWKNRVCFVADYESNIDFFTPTDKLAERVRSENENMAVKKVYLDAFKEVISASGHYYPDAKKLSDQYIEEGALIWAYTGHGSSQALSGSKLMYRSDINSFKNRANLPLWLTATCDFCPYDDNEEVSAGESVLLNPKGGGIALFTTTRLVYSDDNNAISSNFFRYVLNTDNNGNKLRLGDVARLTKRATSNTVNKRKFCLIGDPALQLIHPNDRWSVETDSINGEDILLFTDTLKALSVMSVSGHISKHDGSVDTEYNGVIYPTIYDKISELQTLEKDNTASKSFKMWNSTLYNGQTEVKNGRFMFSFLLPKDLDYKPGKARIEYYATSDDVEVNGCYEDFYVGGFNPNYLADNEGPELNLFLNSPLFQNGGTVNSNPVFMVDVSDASGINTSGSSIGHDITIKLNNDPNSIEIINTSYASSVGDYTQGRVAYQLKDLDDGEYTLTFKIWDMQNNSSTKDISFVVRNNALPNIATVYCYPNPVSLSSVEIVHFVAEHDRPQQSLSVNLNVFDNGGRLVYYSSQYAYSASNDIYFDWTPSGLSSGVYYYRIIIDDGTHVSVGKSEKLILAQ